MLVLDTFGSMFCTGMLDFPVGSASYPNVEVPENAEDHAAKMTILMEASSSFRASYPSYPIL